MLKRIQNLPERKRKIIFWLILIVVGLGLGFFWIKNFQKALKGFQKEEFIKELKLPKFEEEELKSLPQIEIPEMGEELKKLEEKLREAGKESS